MITLNAYVCVYLCTHNLLLCAYLILAESKVILATTNAYGNRQQRLVI